MELIIKAFGFPKKSEIIVAANTYIATILAIGYAVVFYIVGLIVLKILDKNDYYMLPYGEKIYAFLKLHEVPDKPIYLIGSIIDNNSFPINEGRYIT